MNLKWRSIDWHHWDEGSLCEADKLIDWRTIKDQTDTIACRQETLKSLTLTADFQNQFCCRKKWFQHSSLFDVRDSGKCSRSRSRGRSLKHSDSLPDVRWTVWCQNLNHLDDLSVFVNVTHASRVFQSSEQRVGVAPSLHLHGITLVNLLQEARACFLCNNILILSK